ncbi:hypothetical protein V6N13_111654 [Hibiscus sabdariffa]|uniref:Uncharacterized protein n=1 Tax=Hibiscus sabdariffa TaxID=183260 RepID=A0ABR2TL84_9ROSI
MVFDNQMVRNKLVAFIYSVVGVRRSVDGYVEEGEERRVLPCMHEWVQEELPNLQIFCGGRREVSVSYKGSLHLGYVDLCFSSFHIAGF